MNDYPEDTDLIQGLVRYAGTTPAGVAKLAGVAVSTVNRPFNGTAQNRLGRAVLEKLQITFPDFPGWSQPLAASATSDRRLAFHGAPLERVPDLVQVREIDLGYGMGSTYLDVPVTETVHAFARDWIRQYTRAPAEKLFFAQGTGDSMEPTLHDSDVLLVDTAQDTLRMSDRIWVIAYADCGMVKRLRPLPDGGVAILSDKPEVPDTIAHDGEIHIIGRVVAVVRKI